MGIDYNNMRLDALCDIIEQRHHIYVRQALARIEPLLATVVEQMPNENPYMKRVLRKFRTMADDLAMHMQKEEDILFPYIRKLEANISKGNPVPDSHFLSITEPTSKLSTEHKVMREAISDIRRYTSEYNMPDTYSQIHLEAITLLKEFDSDHKYHVHIEDHILFPKAINLETQLNENL